jgi:hypothetical protein
MKIGDLVYEVLLEEIKNKKMFNFLLKKWFGDNPTDEEIAKCEELINGFTQIVNKFSPNNAAIKTFIDMYDGKHGSEFFDEKNLKDITQYSLKQITSLIDEFTDADYQIDDTAGGFSTNLNLTEENIEASRKMWEGNDNLIIDEGSLRVYRVDRQSTSMKYGYYQQMLAEKYNGNQWCVTGRGRENGSQTNLWGGYRNNRTFYFVVDDSKKPTEESQRRTQEFDEVTKFYLCALQVVPNIREGYMLTSMVNDGDKETVWEKIVSIYPQLASYKDTLVPVEYNVKEELDVDTSIFARITETPGSPYEFRRMERRIKKAYLNNMAAIKTLRSWESMDKGLKGHYIVLTNKNNYTDRFQSWEIMNDIKKNTLFVDLDNRLKALGIENGVGAIFTNLMSTSFNVARESLDNSALALFESKETHKYGLYNSRSAKWLTIDGVTYEPNYNEIELEIYVDDEDKSYVVETYSKSGEPDETSFYCLFPVGSDSEKASAHFITAKAFKILSTKIHPKDEDSDTVRISNVNPETDIDIKESIKRRK